MLFVATFCQRFLVVIFLHAESPRISAWVAGGTYTEGALNRGWGRLFNFSDIVVRYDRFLLSYFSVKKTPLSRRVEYVMDGSMDE